MQPKCEMLCKKKQCMSTYHFLHWKRAATMMHARAPATEMGALYLGSWFRELMAQVNKDMIMPIASCRAYFPKTTDLGGFSNVVISIPNSNTSASTTNKA